MHIDSEPGRGTQVNVYLPAVERAQAADDSVRDPSGDLTDSGHDRNILLVDDDDLVRELLGDALRLYGYRVRQANSGQQALEMLDEHVDLLLTDFAMPELNGAQMAKIARERFPYLPVVFLTGYAELQGLELPGSLVIQKPVHHEELARSLGELLGIS